MDDLTEEFLTSQFVYAVMEGRMVSDNPPFDEQEISAEVERTLFAACEIYKALTKKFDVPPATKDGKVVPLKPKDK